MKIPTRITTGGRNRASNLGKGKKTQQPQSALQQQKSLHGIRNRILELPGAERGRKNNVPEKSGLEECRSPGTEPSLATARSGRLFHHMLSRRRGRRGFSGTTVAGRGGGGGAPTSPGSHSSTQQVGGGIGDKNWGFDSRRSIPLLSRAGFAPSWVLEC